ncbi:MAG: hypothetical protein H7321_08670, partial [Bacteroidia bacterium]|nr:hypothetical protein [Bacteroidia bacterium]
MTDKKIQFAIAVLILFLCSSFTGGEAISISEAIHNNLISVTVQGKKTIASGESSHYGQCITMTITNLTSNDISVKLEAGRYFDSEDQSVQDMIVTKESGLKLGPKKAGTFQVYAMCGQKTNSAPSPESKFKIGKLCSGALLGLAKLINNRNYQNATAQSAVWAFTNNASIENIQSADNEMERVLVTYVCKGKKIALPEKYR